MKRKRCLAEELESRARSHLLPKLDFRGVLADYFFAFFCSYSFSSFVTQRSDWINPAGSDRGY
jgi:hypothetical protein